MTLRQALKTTQAQNRKYCLIYWPEEESVSVVASGDLSTESSVGEECNVRIGRKCFVGVVSAIGRKEDMEELEMKYLAGAFTPVKATAAPPTPKKKRTTGVQTTNPQNGTDKGKENNPSGKTRNAGVQTTNPQNGTDKGKENNPSGKTRNADVLHRFLEVKDSLNKIEHNQQKILQQLQHMDKYLMRQYYWTAATSNHRLLPHQQPQQSTQPSQRHAPSNQPSQHRVPSINPSHHHHTPSSQQSQHSVSSNQPSHHHAVSNQPSHHHAVSNQPSQHHAASNQPSQHHAASNQPSQHRVPSNQHRAPSHACRSLQAVFSQCANIPQRATNQACNTQMPVSNISSQLTQQCPPLRLQQTAHGLSAHNAGQPTAPATLMNNQGPPSISNIHSLSSSAISQSTPSMVQEGSTTPEPLPLTTSSCAHILPSSAIKKDTLSSVKDVLFKYSTLTLEHHAGSLACKLAREAIFGEDVMRQCTLAGLGALPGLPVKELYELKKAIFMQFPQYRQKKGEFEHIWNKCAVAIGQACKRLRLHTN